MSRLTPERTDELYAAVLRLLADVGYDKLTMDGVADMTRSSKATLYRQWGSKEALVTSAIGALAPDASELPDTGSLRGDLLALACDHGHAEDAEIGLLVAVIHACKTHPELAESLRERIVASRSAEIGVLLERAVARGEVAADNPALPFVVVTMTGPALLREVIDGEPSDLAYVTRFLDAVLLPALGVTSPSP
ncbi:TetR/AcrR family transcriptional regulator [Mumia sp.]|uniref:TetR/AcrR family transcriptional regulator n=1 Tax=Mumia sp. TaxID=1965300 RepID=UPI002633AA23|nr:TetR/AcrR family transcriptional regulator [Mumia sp.]MDD9349493.1 TetR/AcrR family transcriptional regulator [Mumia sp.]